MGLRRVPRPFAIGGIVVTALLLAIGFLPLFGGPGYEQALATGLVVPAAVAIATAIDAVRGDARTPYATLGRGMLAGLVYFGLAGLTSLVHAARIGICELWGAVLYDLLTAGIGSLMGGAWGAFAGEVVLALAARRPIRRRRLVATVIALAGPVGGVVVGVYRFYTSPMVFSFDPFVGYFSGSLYDTVIDAGTSLLTYRLGSFLTLCAVALFASVVERVPRGLSLRLRTPRERVRGGLGLGAALLSTLLVLVGSKLGQFSTTASIAKDLGSEKHGLRCDVVYPSTTRELEANLLVKDCDEDVVAVEKMLGTRGPERIRAFFFRDENDKKRLMGAAHTYIAKPWRKEVYLQVAPYPHPVLAHELAHVVAGSFGRGPFRIAGSLGGIVPNPGLIEGAAVAASPEDEDLTDAQWARAMLDIGILPPMQRVFSFGFLGDASAKSYMLAGAFITWFGEEFGMDRFRAWYGGGDVVALTGKTWSELDAMYVAHLRTVPLPAEAESFAKGKFARPSIFGRRCPHVVDAIRHEADTCRDTQRFDEAIRLYAEALGKDPIDFASRLSRATVERRHRDREGGRSELEAIATRESIPRPYRDRADEALADADFVDGQLEAARVRYERLAARSLDEDSARTFEVKKLGTESEAARAVVAGLLLGDASRGPDLFVGGVALGRLGDTAFGDYLVGRNLVQKGFFELGAASLDRAIAAGLPTPRLARESLRQRAVAACAVGDQPALAHVKAVLEGPDDPFQGVSAGRRDLTIRMVTRCLR